MALSVTYIVEDGSQVEGATSYLSVDDAKQLMYNRAYDYGSYTDDDFKRTLNKASFYIDSKYGKSMPGYRLNSTGLFWPRSSAVYKDGCPIEETVIPIEIKNAVIEAFQLLSLGTDLLAVIDKSGKVLSSSVKVDVIEEAYSYSNALYANIYPIIDTQLTRLNGGANQSFIIKAIRVGGGSP